MPRPTRILSALVLLSVIALPHSARAQGSAAPKVSIVLHSTDRVITDLKLLLDLTTKTERKQWENIELIIEEFLAGIDTKKPVRVDVLLDGADEQYRFALPVNNLKNFNNNNLGGFGIKARRIGLNLYRLIENRKTIGYMRYHKGYVTISEKRTNVNAVVIPRLNAAIQPAKQLSLSATIKNKAGGEEARRKQFAPIRENLLAALKARRDESTEELAVRRELLDLELNEAERFLAESESLAMGFRIDPKTRKATLDLDLSAIAGSDLDKSIRGLSKSPSHFASVPRATSTILSFRIHHPLDNFRRTSLQLVLAATQKAIQADITRTASATDAQKAASTTVLDNVVAIIQSTLKQGLLDAFIEVRPVKTGHNVMIAGIRTVEGQRLRAALAAIPNSTVPNNVKLDTDKIGDVSIHQLTVPAEFNDEFVSLFGKSNTILIGTSSDAAWCAAGPGALAALTAAITARGKPAKTPPKPDPIFVDLAITLGPWVKALEGRMTTKEEVADHKLAVKAFAAGQDTVELRLRRDDARVLGRLSLGTGILRFLGKKLAEFSKENFE